MMMFQVFLRSGSQLFPGQNEMQPGRSKIQTVERAQDVSRAFSGEIKEKRSSVEYAIESELYPNVAIGSKKDTTWFLTQPGS